MLREILTLRLIGYLLTLFYAIGLFFAGRLTFAALLAADMAGVLAFALFALLLARGLMRTGSVFLYFLRITVTAFVTEGLLYLASRRHLVFTMWKNPLFTYAAGIGVAVGLAMVCTAFYRMVARLQPAGGDKKDGEFYHMTVQPGDYNMPPLLGLALGLGVIGLSVYTALRMRFAYGLYGLLIVTAFVLALRETDETDPLDMRSRLMPVMRRLHRSLFENSRKFIRAMLYLIALHILLFLADLTVLRHRLNLPFSYLMTLLAPGLALLFPEPATRPSHLRRVGRYAFLPLAVLILTVIRYLTT